MNVPLCRDQRSPYFFPPVPSLTLGHAEGLVIVLEWQPLFSRLKERGDSAPVPRSPAPVPLSPGGFRPFPLNSPKLAFVKYQHELRQPSFV